MAETPAHSPYDNTDFFLKIEGIKGETKTEGLNDYIRILSFRWGGSHTGSFHRDEGGATGRFKPIDFSFLMKTNVASPELMTAYANGKHFPRATLVCRKAIGNKAPLEYLKVSLSPVMITEFETSFDPSLPLGDAVVVDKVSLSFGKIVVEYRVNTNEGTPGPAKEGGFDVQRGRTGS